MKRNAWGIGEGKGLKICKMPTHGWSRERGGGRGKGLNSARDSVMGVGRGTKRTMGKPACVSQEED